MPDIQTSMYFMCTRVHDTYIDNWKKLQRTIRYLEASRCLPLTLEADGIMIIKWWIDTSYGVQEDYQGHMGGTISLGKVHPHSKYSKQKLNIQSSTESELVGTENIMPMMLWNCLFMEEQGYEAN